MVSWTICPGLALNHDPPDICFLSSYNYRGEPPAPSSPGTLRMETKRLPVFSQPGPWGHLWLPA
jgi:hypothetical protein